MSEHIYVIHVLNKPSVGGAEKLVESIIQSNTLTKTTHSMNYIANNKIEISLFSYRILRLFPMLFQLIKIQCLIFKSEIRKRRTCIVFHLAEAHVINHLIYVKSNSRFVRTIHYVHQSKDLYPTKLHSTAYSSANKSDLLITYSTLVLDSWHFKELKFISLPNPVSSDILKYSVDDMPSAYNFDSLNFIFIGRLAKWKRPDKCMEFVSYFTKKYITSLKIVGFEKLEFEKLYGDSFLDKYKNVDIKFLGVKSDVKTEIINSDINLYFADSIHSYESIGISSEECLVLGVPTVITNKQFTQFKESPGIYEFSDFIENEELRNNTTDIITNLHKNRASISNYWKDLASIQRYLKNFNEQLIKLYS
jgi:hypothetical protein